MQLCPAPSASNTEPDAADASLPPAPLSGKSTLESFIYNSGLLLRNSFLGQNKGRCSIVPPTSLCLAETVIKVN